MIRPARHALEVAVRLRYLVLLAVTALVAGLTWATRKPGLHDWLWFEFGGRTIAHEGGVYSSGLHLYARHPEIQIGPPPLALVAGLQWLPPAVVEVIFVAVMALCGVLIVWCGERIARTVIDADSRRIANSTFGAGIVVVALWSAEAARWEHLDDVMAITFGAVALMLAVRQRRWWQASLLMGLAVAAKPWAIVLAPMLLALPRSRRAPGALIAMATAAGCWAPFVLADRGTVSALGQVRLPVSPTSSLVALGVHVGSIAPAWVRPLQLAGGFLLMWWLARGGRWAAVPLVGLLLRVVTDPQTWQYYGVGPLVGAFLWELYRERRIPVMTFAVAAVEFGGPLTVPAAMPWLRLVLAAACVIAVCRSVVPGARDAVRIDELADHARGVARDQRVIGYVPAHDGAGGH